MLSTSLENQSEVPMTDVVEDAECPWDVFPVLVGDIDNLPPLSSKTVRVFLSSTFSDMSPERNALMEFVYPQLKNFCRQQYRLEFQMMDLRWGIRDQSRDDHTIVEFCLREIENCQKQSLGPFFVILLGQKYGYRPFPSTIDAVEFETIRLEIMKSSLSSDDVKLLDTWFKMDSNVIPPVYRLQPISSRLEHYRPARDFSDSPELHENAVRQWEETFKVLQSVLRVGVSLCVERGLLSQEARNKYFMSVTEYEIERGLNNSSNPANTCLCFNRYIVNLEENVHQAKAQRYLDTLPGEDGHHVIDPEAQALLARLQNETIPRVLTDERNTEVFELAWNDPERGNYPSDDPEYIKSFCETFREKMQWLISRSAAQAISVSCSQEVIVEILQHLNTCKTRSQLFRGRQEALARIRAYLDQTATRPLVLYGESGSGKTALVAKVVREIKVWTEANEIKPVIVLRFLGTTSQSCNIRLVLQSICWQIASACGLDASAIPVGYPELVEYFHQILMAASVIRPLILLLDGLNQLSPDHRAYSLAWLPKNLPENVHFLLSTLTDKHAIMETLTAIIQHRYSPASKESWGGIHGEETEGELQPTEVDRESFIEVLPLGAELSADLIREWLDAAHRRITSEQFEVAKRALEGCSLPLYASLVFEEVCRWRSYFDTTETVLAPTVASIINSLFERIERYHGRIFVSHSLSYLTASRNGLSDVELEDLLSLDDIVLNDVFQHWVPPLRRVPPLLITRLKDELSSYLTMRETNGTVVFYWYHSQFISAVRERYLDKEQHSSYIYSTLAHYYLGTWGRGTMKSFKYSFKQLQNFGSSRRRAKAAAAVESEADRKVPDQPLHFGEDAMRPGRLNYNVRKLCELPYYLVEARMFIDLKDHVLFNYDWLHAKLSATSLHDVLADFSLAMEAGLTDVDVQLLAGALRAGGSRLNRHPDSLAFDLLGRLLPYYGRHGDKHDGIRTLLQQCDIRSLRHSALLPVLPCFDAPSAMVLYVLEGHSLATSDVVFSASTNELVSASKDGTVAFWDLSTGERSRSIDISALSPGRKTRLYLSPDGTLLVVDSDALDSPVHVYDVKTTRLLHSFGVRLPTQQRGFLTGNLLCRQKSIFDVRTGREIHTIDDFVSTKSYVTCALSPDGQLILVSDTKTDGTHTIQVFDFETIAHIASFPSANPPSVLTVAADGRRAFVGYANDCLLRVLNINRQDPPGEFGEVVAEFDCSFTLDEITGGTASMGVLSDQLFPRELSELHCSPVSGAQSTAGGGGRYAVLVNVRRHRLILLDVDSATATVMNELTNERAQIIMTSSFSFDGRYVLACVENMLKVWQAHSGMFMQSIPLHSTSGFAFAVSSQRNLVATGSTINTAIRVLDLDKAQNSDVPELKVYENPVDCVACAPDTRLAFVKNYYGLSSSTDGYKYMNYFGLDVWNISTGSTRTLLPFDRYGKLLQMSVSPDGGSIAVLLNVMHNFTTVVLNTRSPPSESSNDNRRVRSGRSNYMPILCEASHDECTSFQISPNWKHLVTCSECSTETSSANRVRNVMILWDVPSPDGARSSIGEGIPGHKVVSFDGATSPAFTFDSRLLLYIDLGRTTVIAYDLETLAPRYRLVNCRADRLLALPRHRRHVLVTSCDTVLSRVHIWELSRTPRPTVELTGEVGSTGILSVSADGRLAVDGRLQVFDLTTGRITQRFSTSCNATLHGRGSISTVGMGRGGLDAEKGLGARRCAEAGIRKGSEISDESILMRKEHSMVRLTDDGRFVVWVDDLAVKVGRVCDGSLVANTTTHERPTCLETLDHGYVLIVGREDGHVLTMKLLVGSSSKDDVTSRSSFSSTSSLSSVSSHRSTYRPRSVGDRRNFMLDSDVCSPAALAAMDDVFRHEPRCVADVDLPSISDDVIGELVRKAVIPHTIIDTSTTALGRDGEDTRGDPWGVRDRKRGSSPLTTWRNVTGSPLILAGSPSKCNGIDYRSNTPSPVLFGSRDELSLSSSNVANGAVYAGRPGVHAKPPPKRSKSAQDLYRVNPLVPGKENGRDGSGRATLSKTSLARAAMTTELKLMLHARLSNKDRPKTSPGTRSKSPQTGRAGSRIGWFGRVAADKSPSKHPTTSDLDSSSGEKKDSSTTAGAKATEFTTSQPERRTPLRALLQLKLSSGSGTSTTRVKQVENGLTSSTACAAMGTPIIMPMMSRQRTPSL